MTPTPGSIWRFLRHGSPPLTLCLPVPLSLSLFYLSLSHTNTHTHSLSHTHSHTHTHTHSLTHTHTHTHSLSLSHTHTLSLSHTHTLSLPLSHSTSLFLSPSLSPYSISPSLTHSFLLSISLLCVSSAGLKSPSERSFGFLAARISQFSLIGWFEGRPTNFSSRIFDLLSGWAGLEFYNLFSSIEIMTLWYVLCLWSV